MVQQITADKLGLPVFTVKEPGKTSYGLFDFSSHARAREALAHALQINQPGFNVFLIGENRSGRLSATLGLLKAPVLKPKRASSWVYVHNFDKPHEPLPFQFPQDQAALFAHMLSRALGRMSEKYARALTASYFTTKAQASAARLEKYITSQIDALRAFAQQHNFDLQWDREGAITPLYLNEKDDPHFERVDPRTWDQLIEKLQDLDAKSEEKQAELQHNLRARKRQILQAALQVQTEKLHRKFHHIQGMEGWLNALAQDFCDSAEVFEQNPPEARAQCMARYAVNLLVDCAAQAAAPLVVEPTPSYENLFGQVMYETTHEGYRTDHRMIRAGALHQANGGVLVLRADALLSHPQSWEALKIALRDQEIRLEDAHAPQSLPLWQAPRPQPIPLDVKIILIGTPSLYELFLTQDPDFQTYFKVKAEIEESMEASARNIRVAADLLQQASLRDAQMPCTPEALAYLLGYSTRWTEDRQKLPSQFEKLQDVVAQAAAVVRQAGRQTIACDDIQSVLNGLEQRNQGPQQRAQELIEKKILHIETQGAVVGQVNGLSVMSGSDVVYGLPMRITATTAMGAHGIVNVERQTQMSGPLHQKSVFILEGFLQRRFAQDFPLCMSCMLTFEQNYALIDGDSASLAEVCAVLSSLAEIPVRQDIAITGSMNQFGQAQAVGGVPYKIEAFYDTCRRTGLTGQQGVIIPQANIKGLVLKDALVSDVRDKKFNIWAVRTAEEALALLLDRPIRATDTVTDPRTVWGQVYRKLRRFAQYHVPGLKAWDASAPSCGRDAE